MKKNIILFILISFNINAQSLKFDKINTQCEDKWIAHQMDKDSIYSFGFIYIDSQAGLTFNYEGKFKIDKNGKFNRIKEELISLKHRLEPNRIALAEIPESKYQELNIQKKPDWLRFYKTDENTIERLFKWGFMYNGWGNPEKALLFLEKADKMNSNFKGLQTELAYSYNALEKFDKAEIALKKAIEQNPKDCYSLKELAYTYNHLDNLEKSIETYNKMVSTCSEKDWIQETAFNMTYAYFKAKDKTKFKYWNLETRKWSNSENKITQYLDRLQAELK